MEKDSTWFTVKELVEISLQQGNSTRVIQLLESRIDETFLSVPREEWKEWAVKYAEALEMNAPKSKTADSARKLAKNPSDINAAVRLGIDLVNANRLDGAIAILSEARQIDPKNVPVLSEMVAALEISGRHQEAFRILTEAPDVVASNAHLTYLLAFNAFFIADVDTPRRLLPTLKKSNDDTIKFMTRRIERMLERADFMKKLNGLDNLDERSWHFVLTGGLLIHKSSDDRSSYDTETKLLADINGLMTILNVWGIIPKKILFPPEHNSEIIAHLAANIIDVPTEKFFGSTEEGLITIYDSSCVLPELLKPLRTAYLNQYFFQCVANSQMESSIAPDFMSRFYQRNSPIWGPGFTEENVYIEPWEGNPKAIADRVGSSVSQKIKSGGQQELSVFAKAVYEFVGENYFTSAKTESLREHLWNGSPARSLQMP